MQGYDKDASDGYRAWTKEEIQHFLEKCGDREFTAFLLAVYSTQRPGDIRKLTWMQYDGDFLNIGRQSKTKAPIRIPVHPVLKAHLDTLERGTGTILQDRHGDAYSADALSSMFAGALDRMNMPKGVTMYGLRTTGATVLADGGATPHMIASMTGHRTLAMVSHYSRGADQGRLAAASVGMLPDMVRTGSAKPARKLPNRDKP